MHSKHFTGTTSFKFSKDLVMWQWRVLLIPYLDTGTTLHDLTTASPPPCWKNFFHLASRTSCPLNLPPASLCTPQSPWLGSILPDVLLLEAPMTQPLEPFLPTYTHSPGEFIQSSSFKYCHMLTSPNFSSSPLYLNARPIYSIACLHLKGISFNTPTYPFKLIPPGIFPS